MHAEFIEASRTYYTAIELEQVTEALAEDRGLEILQRGMRRVAEAASARAETEWVSPMQIAYLYSFAGDADQTLFWLERGFEGHDPEMPYQTVWPSMDFVRDDPRHEDLLRRMGLPE
jgi:hypothetical protein